MDSFYQNNMSNPCPVLHRKESNLTTARSIEFLLRLAPHFPLIRKSFIMPIIILKMGSCAPQLINEEVLLLEHHHMGDSGMKNVLAQYNTRVVKELDVAGNKLTPLSLRSFPKAKWSSLTFLSFNKNNLGDKGCKYLSMASLNRMQRLILAQNNVGNAGVLHLSKAVWKSLKYLSLSFNRIQHQGAQHLSKAKWASIEQIKAQKNKVDDAFHLTSTIIVVDSLQQEQKSLQKQNGKVVKAYNSGAFMDNGLLLQLY